MPTGRRAALLPPMSPASSGPTATPHHLESSPAVLASLPFRPRPSLPRSLPFSHSLRPPCPLHVPFSSSFSHHAQRPYPPLRLALHAMPTSLTISLSPNDRHCSPPLRRPSRPRCVSWCLASSSLHACIIHARLNLNLVLPHRVVTSSSPHSDHDELTPYLRRAPSRLASSSCQCLTAASRASRPPAATSATSLLLSSSLPFFSSASVLSSPLFLFLFFSFSSLFFRPAPSPSFPFYFFLFFFSASPFLPPVPSFFPSAMLLVASLEPIPYPPKSRCPCQPYPFSSAEPTPYPTS